ncbi:hypothetical protein ACHAWF_009332 [Thalassiosira exigua]
MIKRSAAATVLALASAFRCVLFTEAFATPQRRRSPFGFGRRPKRALYATAATATRTPPSWDELSTILRDATADGEPPKPPLVTLYRDTNGWCPFCERVWLVLRAKGIPYEEQLVSLQNKPDWYKALVPTTLVPAVLFHEPVDEGGDDTKKNERRIVWESEDILKALEEEFPESPRMVHDTPEYEAAVRMNNDMNVAGFNFIYAGRNNTLTEEDKKNRKIEFLAELDRLEEALARQQKQSSTRADDGGGGCFRLGVFSAVDSLMIPTLERWRYQLPLTVELDILEGRPALSKWFEAMDSYEPYANRVAGDEYSWTAANSMFLRYFGGGDDKPEVAAGIERADDAAERLSRSFGENAAEEGGDKTHSKEAAAKLISNHEAVVEDCTRDDPKSQQHIDRALGGEDAADAVLRHVVSLLLSENDTLVEARVAPLPDTIMEGGSNTAKVAALAARIVATRLCVPRDMSAPAASILRATLATVADRLEG